MAKKNGGALLSREAQALIRLLSNSLVTHRFRQCVPNFQKEFQEHLKGLPDSPRGDRRPTRAAIGWAGGVRRKLFGW